jgi:hypothetical protein
MLAPALVAVCFIMTGMALFVTADSPFNVRGIVGLILYVSGFIAPLVLV